MQCIKNKYYALIVGILIFVLGIILGYGIGSDNIHYKVLDNTFKCSYHSDSSNDWDYVYEVELRYLKPNDKFMHMKVLAKQLTPSDDYIVYVLNNNQINSIECYKLK